MANRIAGNVYIIDSGSISLPWPGTHVKIQGVGFYSTDTSGELQLTMASNTLNIVFWLRNNNNQPYFLPQYLGGVNFEQLRVQILTAGTGFLYLA